MWECFGKGLLHFLSFWTGPESESGQLIWSCSRNSPEMLQLISVAFNKFKGQ